MTVPKCGFASTFDPWRRRHVLVRRRDDVLAPIRRESTQPVEEDADPGAATRRTARRFSAAGSGRREARHGFRRDAAAVDLVRQRPSLSVMIGTGDRLEQHAVLGRDLFRESHKDAARSIASHWPRRPAAINPMIWS